MSDSDSLSSKGSDTATDCVTGGLSESLNKLWISICWARREEQQISMSNLKKISLVFQDLLKTAIDTKFQQLSLHLYSEKRNSHYNAWPMDSLADIILCNKHRATTTCLNRILFTFSPSKMWSNAFLMDYLWTHKSLDKHREDRKQTRCCLIG